LDTRNTDFVNILKNNEPKLEKKNYIHERIVLPTKLDEKGEADNALKSRVNSMQLDRRSGNLEKNLSLQLKRGADL
jgi:hypothetical protein